MLEVPTSKPDEYIFFFYYLYGPKINTTKINLTSKDIKFQWLIRLLFQCIRLSY